MLVIQHNCGRGCKSIIVLLATLLSIEAKIVYLQKPFIKNKSITHSAFNFYWQKKLKTEAQFFTTVKKKLMNKIIVENKIDLIDHPYFLAQDIRDMDSQ